MLVLYLVKDRTVICTVSVAFSIAVANTTVYVSSVLSVKASFYLAALIFFFFLKGKKLS